MTKSHLRKPAVPRFAYCAAVLLFFHLLSPLALGGQTDPVTGLEFDRLVEAQHLDLQHKLETLFPETEGFHVTGPQDPLFDASRIPGRLRGTSVDCFGDIRVICADMTIVEKARAIINENNALVQHSSEVMYHILSATITHNDSSRTIRFPTVQQIRFSIWFRRALLDINIDIDSTENQFVDYAVAVMEYFHIVDSGILDAEPPRAVNYNLPESLDLYASPPEYVIQGYQNYKDFMQEHGGIKTEFAHKILSFVPTGSLLTTLRDNAPHAAYPNKEAPMLQREYRKFTERGGDIRTMHLLTKNGFDSLSVGEYFFAVSAAGRIRYGRELLREEVEQIEKKTGRKVPRANHAFLFPGEMILTAGAFFVEREDGTARLTAVNAQSGHYFYSNVTPTIRTDISIKSNEYLLSLGHLLTALDRLGIPYEGVLISKF